MDIPFETVNDFVLWLADRDPQSIRDYVELASALKKLQHPATDKPYSPPLATYNVPQWIGPTEPTYSENPFSTRGQAFAIHVRSGKRETQAQRVLEYIKTHPGRSREDIATALDMRTASCTARVSELLAAQKIWTCGAGQSSSGHRVELLAVV